MSPARSGGLRKRGKKCFNVEEKVSKRKNSQSTLLHRFKCKKKHTPTARIARVELCTESVRLTKYEKREKGKAKLHIHSKNGQKRN